jgi:deoxyguanosine kinase
MPRWFAVEGVIGAGKTTTVELAAPALDGVRAIVEQIDDHPFLAGYHRDPAAYAFETELVFMALHRYQIGPPPSTDFLTDYTPEKELVFGAATLGEEDLAMLGRIRERVWRDLGPPSLAIFLDVPTEECLRRVRLRGRPYELELGGPFLERLREGYLGRLSDLADRVVRLGLNGTETPAQVARLVCDLIGSEREASPTGF